MIFAKQEKFITGNEAVVEAALAAGASFFAGYPITPATEILEEWAKLASVKFVKKNSCNSCLQFLQAEDETSAGFNIIGAILAGRRAFTATAGVGHILMQDPIAMAEAMRLPFVGIIMQRGGPSTGTVIYSQQEVTMACYGGNGEGLRVVYSTTSPQELYDYTIKAFETAWKYRFPTFVLGDGYQSKEKTKVRITNRKSPIVNRKSAIGNLRNCYNFENELYQVLEKNINEFNKISSKIAEYETYRCDKAETVIFAHGIVSLAAKEAMEKLKIENCKLKIGLFRPITLNPFPRAAANRFTAKAKRILIVESSAGQFARIVKDSLSDGAKIDTLFKPALPITADEIIDKLLNG